MLQIVPSRDVVGTVKAVEQPTFLLVFVASFFSVAAKLPRTRQQLGPVEQRNEMPLQPD